MFCYAILHRGFVLHAVEPAEKPLLAFRLFFQTDKEG
jgi:hypothetical protein